MSSNLHKHSASVTDDQKQWLYGHKSCVLWLTGLSGSGKSTLANRVEKRLFDMGCNSHVLDGDNVRMGLNKDLGFSPADRKENIRRIGEVANLFKESGTITLTAFISPYEEDRKSARQSCEDRFFEIYVKAPLEVCESRDPKGLYKKARAGIIKNFTGIGAPYEEPKNPDLTVNTAVCTIEECVDSIVDMLVNHEVISIPKEVSILDKKTTLAIDFDGVIHKYSKGFQGLDNVYDGPHPGAISGIKQLSEMGYRLIIVSSRPVNAIRPWLVANKIDHYFDEITNIKRPAKYYVDDHGYYFEKGSVNSWPKLLKMIKGEKND